MKKIFLATIVLLTILFAGCTVQNNNNGVETPADDSTNTVDDSGNQGDSMNDDSGDSMADDTGGDAMDDAGQGDTPVVSTKKLVPPYACDDPVLKEKMKSVLGPNVDIKRKPAPFGKTINYVVCNIIKGADTIQVEFHDTASVDTALVSMEDEVQQIGNQVTDAVTKTETIGEKSYSITSEKSTETWVFYVDSDPSYAAIFVKVKSIAGGNTGFVMVKDVAAGIEEII